MKRRLIIIVLVAFLAAGGYVYASYNKMLPEKFPEVPLEIEKFEEIKPPEFDSLPETTKGQLETFSSRAKKLGNYAQDAIKTGIQVDDSEPVHEQVIDYGQYVYCKQVVETYEKNKE